MTDFVVVGVRDILEDILLIASFMNNIFTWD